MKKNKREIAKSSLKSEETKTEERSLSVELKGITSSNDLRADLESDAPRKIKVENIPRLRSYR